MPSRSGTTKIVSNFTSLNDNVEWNKNAMIEDQWRSTVIQRLIDEHEKSFNHSTQALLEAFEM